MTLHKHVQLMAGAAVIFAAFSCASSKLNKQVAEQKVIEQQLVTKMDTAEKTLNKKIDEGTVDSYTQHYLQEKVVSIKENIRTSDSSITANRKGKNKDMKKATAMASLFTAATKRNLEDINIINKLFDLNTMQRFNTGAFFGPGEYRLKDSSAEAQATFTELIKNAYKFGEEFPGRKFNANIVVTGYADAQGFNQTGELYEELKKLINKENPQNSDFNKEISRLRAVSIASAVKDTKEKYNYADSLQRYTFNYYAEGKGEELPKGKIKDYKDDDERRRVVLVYWTVLPD